MDAKQFLKVVKDKKFWFSSALIAWAAALQGHVMWLQKQESFQQKLGILEDDNDNYNNNDNDNNDNDNDNEYSSS